jgi:hypothetical protein
VLLGYYQSHLVGIGWLGEGQEHLPVSWLTIAALGGVAGIVWMARWGRGRFNRPASDAAPDAIAQAPARDG